MTATRELLTHNAVGVGAPALSADRLSVLIVDAAPEQCANPLRERYAPVVGRSVSDATRQLTEIQPAIVITELVLPDGDGVEICRTANALSRPPLVVVTTAALERVPAALISGCNTVLLKPYSPTLLCTRIGRLLQLSDRAARSVTTNQIWNDIQCPACGRPGATSFDFASYRRMWCACLACEHVWVARRWE